MQIDDLGINDFTDQSLFSHDGDKRLSPGSEQADTRQVRISEIIQLVGIAQFLIGQLLQRCSTEPAVIEQLDQLPVIERKGHTQAYARIPLGSIGYYVIVCGEIM